MIAALADATGLPFTEARNHFEAQGARDALVELSRRAAHDRGRPHQDLQRPALDGVAARATGLGEIHLPDLQPGSSIMPGKVNPVLPEATLMVCAQVVGNDAAVAWRGRVGQLRAQRDDAGDGAQPARVDPAAVHRRAGCSPTAASTASPPTRSGCARYAESSPSVVTPLNQYIGYEEAAKIAKQALAEERDDPRDRARAGLRRARRPHRGAARRGPRRGGDDPPVSRERHRPPHRTCGRSTRPRTTSRPAARSGTHRRRP